MKRRLALFFDGTWNRRSTETNVWRLYELTASRRKFTKLLGQKTKENAQEDQPQVQQLKYYHEGVGAKWGEKVWGGAFGYGLSRNIKDGYLWLSKYYQPGDDIYIFGFSRGAYTARSLVGLIRKCGIPRTPDEGLTKEAYQIYREKKWHPDGREAMAFNTTFSHPDTRIKLVGVWDTVGALGIPAHGILFGKEYYSWHDTELSRMVQNAYHAMAMDEHRPDFAATVWSKDKRPGKGQNVEQRWFPGSHADVGGGYKGGTLQQIPLRWMQEKAAACGLEFTSPAGVDDDAYLGQMHDSFGAFAFGLYARLPWIYPYYRPREMGVHEKIDDSIRRRMESPLGKDERGKNYAPLAMQ
jgi:uncharacterized protein (DUF2235 family)